MSNNFFKNCIRCCFDSNRVSGSDKTSTVVDVFFAKTKDLSSSYTGLKKYINLNDKLKADRMYFSEDRDTYLFCHTLLRLVLSRKLRIDPSDLLIINDINNKPGLQGDLLFFNVSHTREAFSFAISDRLKVGIDLEKVDREIDFRSIIKTFFSSGEVKFILEDPDKSQERFFLLWTRKEALLKALGTGIVDKLQEVEVFRDINFLNHESFNNIIDNSFFCDHYIYSEKILNNYFSIAVPARAKIILHHLDIQIIKTLIHELETWFSGKTF